MLFATDRSPLRVVHAFGCIITHYTAPCTVNGRSRLPVSHPAVPLCVSATTHTRVIETTRFKNTEYKLPRFAKQV